MRLPGFTAEAALAPAVERYARGQPTPASGSGRGVLPQAGWVVDPECYQRCLRLGRRREDCIRMCGRPAWM